MSNKGNHDWPLKGLMDSDESGHKRFKYGNRKLGARLETSKYIVYVSLTDDGVLTVNFGIPGVVGSRLVLKGRLATGDNRLPKLDELIPNLGLQSDRRDA